MNRVGMFLKYSTLVLFALATIGCGGGESTGPVNKPIDPNTVPKHTKAEPGAAPKPFLADQ